MDKVVHFEIPADDLVCADKFYSDHACDILNNANYEIQF